MKQTKNHLLFLPIIIIIALSLIPFFNVKAQEGYEWIEKKPSPFSRLFQRLAEVNGKIYAMGGGEFGTYFSTNEMYDTAIDNWTNKTSMLSPKGFFAIASYQNKIYTIDRYNNLEVYYTTTDTWTTKTSMPSQEPRQLFNAHTVDDKIYVIGGQTIIFADTNPASSSEVNIYDPKKDTWIQGEPIPYAVCGYASAVFNNKIYVIGGYDYRNTIGSVYDKYDFVQIYDTLTDSWSFGEPIPESSIIFPRAGMTTGTMTPEGIYVIGRIEPDDTTSLTQIYDPVNDSWSDGVSLPMGLSGDVIVVDDFIYAISGSQNYKLVTAGSETPTPSPTPTSTPTPTPESEPFPTTIAVSTIVIISIIGIGILVYFKKYKK